MALAFWQEAEQGVERTALETLLLGSRTDLVEAAREVGPPRIQTTDSPNLIRVVRQHLIPLRAAIAGLMRWPCSFFKAAGAEGFRVLCVHERRPVKLGCFHDCLDEPIRCHSAA
jgi:hypothetical protein